MVLTPTGYYSVQTVINGGGDGAKRGLFVVWWKVKRLCPVDACVAPADENLLKFKFRSTRYGHRSGHRSPKNQNAYMDLIITIVDSH